MRIHYLQHVPFEGLGSIANWLTENGFSTTHTALFNGEKLPNPEDIDFLIIMGGPMGIYDDDAYPWLIAERAFIKQVLSKQKVVLGICLGAQFIAAALGARVKPNKHKEIGWFPVVRADELSDTVWAGYFPNQQSVFHWHGDTFDIPQGAVRIAHSEACRNQGFVYQDRVLALQFHLETTADSADALIKNCADEIVPAPYVQDANEMRHDQERFTKVNSLMATLMGFLIARINAKQVIDA